MRHVSTQVPNLIRQYIGEDQNPTTVAAVLEKVKQILTHGEDVAYIATQTAGAISITPDCVVLTNKRFII